MADVLSTEVDAICIDTLDDIWLESFVRTHPFLDRLSIKKAGGSGYRIPVQTGGGGGTSGNFADSLANSAANGFTGTAFTVPPAIAYGTERIQWQDAVLADTEQSPVDLAMNATKNALNIAVENLSNMIIGSSSGAAGSYSTISTATQVGATTVWDLLLTPASDAAKFTEGQTVISKATASAALDTGTGEVIGVNAAGGRIRVDVSSWTPTANHIIGLEGQLPATTDTSGLFPSVLQWIPTYANRTNGVPTTTTFLGVNRAADSMVNFVSGFGFLGTAMPMFQAVYTAAATMVNVSKLAKPDVVYVNPLALPRLASEAGQQMRYDMRNVSGVEVGFAGFECVLPTGRAEVLAEPSMPVNQILLSRQGSWELAMPKTGKIFMPATNGKLIIDDYGTGSTPTNQSRATVMAVGFFGCNDPVSNAMIQIATPTGLTV